MTPTRKKPTVAPDECRFLIQPVDGASVVQIGPRGVYLVREARGHDGERVWQFTTTKGRAYTVAMLGTGGMTCSCPDRLFRRRSCKHQRTVQQLYPPVGGWY